ncbi:MAG: bifunctional adenosylcobinamide kinase/adenosylcobinamide-phosphate guanylyltransferase [Magnetococcales bacterium]|nr:bifunctional adenosylcobinamide kinase/adenosylcobinamide-phosphate guanylyltransferase [Magnetococcales bacterium]
MGGVELVLGGARSGKSRHAADLAAASGLPVSYIATARAGDDEMAERIARHRAERPPAWRVVEEPLALAEALRREAEEGRFVVVDCLTLWLLNGLEAGEERFSRERAALLETAAWLEAADRPAALVGNEVGWGVVPLGALSRRFVDENGWMHQDLGRLCRRVTLLAAGLPLVLKGEAS